MNFNHIWLSRAENANPKGFPKPACLLKHDRRLKSARCQNAAAVNAVKHNTHK